MAIILKQGQSIKNRYDASDNTAAYAAIEELSINKKNRAIRYDVHIWASKAARVAGLDPLSINSVGVTGPEFNQYFDKTAGKNIWAQAYAHLETLTSLSEGINLAHWKKDAGEED